MIDEELLSKFVDRDDAALHWIVPGLGLPGAPQGESEYEGHEGNNEVTKPAGYFHITELCVFLEQKRGPAAADCVSALFTKDSRLSQVESRSPRLPDAPRGSAGDVPAD